MSPAHGGVIASRRRTAAAPTGMLAKKFVITAPTSAGTTTADLSGVFSASEPCRAVILWTYGATAAGASDGGLTACHGLVTRDAGGIQQGFVHLVTQDGLALELATGGINDTAALRGYSTTSAADYVASCTAFSDTSITLNWTDPPAAAIKVHGLALGGSSVTAARCAITNLTSSVANSDLTVGWSAGKPDLCLSFYGNGRHTAVADLAAEGNSGLGMSVFWDASHQQAAVTHHGNSQDITNLGAAHRPSAVWMFSNTAAPAIFAEADVAANANWPAQGVRLSSTTIQGVATRMLVLFLKGSFGKALGTLSTPTVVQSNFLSGVTVPRAALFWGVNQPASASLISSGTDLLGWFIGASDMTTQGGAGYTALDGSQTTSHGRWHSESTAVQEYAPVAAGLNPPTLAGEASVAAAGSNVVATWNDPDTFAREVRYLLLGN